MEMIPASRRLKRNHSCDLSNTAKLPGFSSLPHEILMKILCLVPAEDVFQLRCVCREWRGLIAGEEFSRRHLEQRRSSRKEEVIVCATSTTDDPWDDEGVLTADSCISFDDLKNGMARVRSRSLGLEGCLRSAVNDLNLPELWDMNLQVLDSCNGLLLLQLVRREAGNLYDGFGLILCNPVTRTYRHISFAPPYKETYRCRWSMIYDSSMRKYKIIGLMKGCEMRPRLRCFVYELHHHHRGEQSSSSWKELLNLPSGCGDIGPALFVDGKLLCMVNQRATSKTTRKKPSILSLDIATGKFTLFSSNLPPYSWGYDYQFAAGGKLYQTYHLGSEKIELWILEDFDNLVWSKHRVINLAGTEIRRWHTRCHQLHPITVLDEDCKIIMSFELKGMMVLACDQSSGKSWTTCAEFKRFAPTISLLSTNHTYDQYVHHVNSLTSWNCPN